ncbi:hypothetical protein AB0M87_04535 [Streptomyces sp. NPDC051320]|uniref:hypothetical protein n=1 Tax=Streptomyces sp. NPDC051320 TaxID=3154644 RepID=UPI00343938A4
MMQQGMELDWLAAQVFEELPTVAARRESLALIAAVRADPARWPAAGGEELSEAFGRYSWISYVAHRDGIQVLDIGWAR